MVGVPGRGKGCSTCKRRKKRCDLQMPTCGNCAKRSQACGGYAREMLIVHVDSSGKGTYKPQTLVSEPTLPPKEHYQASNFCSPTDFRIRDLNRTSLEFLNINTFWDTYLPSPRMATGEKCFPFTSGAVSRWAGYTTHYLPQTETVRCALLALSTAHLGKAQGNVYLLQRGFELYGHALTQVGNALMAPNGRKNFCLLNSCRLLALFEELFDIDGKSTATNWRGHVHGLVNLIQHHPLEAFCLPGKHEVFLEARFEGILSAMCDRKATFLASPGWMTKPWVGRSKSAFDTALDITAKIPAMLEEFETLMCQDFVPETEERARRLKERLWQMEDELTLWYENFIRLYDISFADPEGLELLIAGRGDPARQVDLPEVLIQQGVAPLYAMTMFWTCCAVIYEKMLQMHETFPPSKPKETPLPETSRLSLLKYCICLSRSTRLLSEPGAGLSSSTLFAGAAVACILAGYLGTKRETEAEREDMIELKRGSETLIGRNHSMWTQTWSAGMNHMKWEHDPWMARCSESTPRFWAGKHWYIKYKLPLAFLE